MANNYRYYTIEYQFINGRLLPNGKKIYNLGYMQQGDSYTNVLRVKIPDEYSSSVGSVLVNVQRPDKTKVANGLYLTYNAVDGYYERKLERWFTEMSGQYDLDVSVVQATSIDSGEEDELGNPIMVSPLDMAGRVTYYVNESSYAAVGEELLPAVEDEFRTAISSLDASKINKDGTNSDIGSIAFQTDIEQTVAEGEIGYDNSDNEFHFGKSDGGVDKFSNKVDKVAGKELSTNDYTDLEQTKLGTIEENAEVNIIEVVKDSAGTPLEVASEDRSVTLTKSVVGLGNVDNTSDTDKPISTAQQGALDTKPSIATFDGATGTVSFYKETVLVGGETPLFTVDLPTEALVVSGAYDAETEIITLTLANGSTIEIDASGLINANELVDAIATKLGLDFSALNAMGTIDTANDLVAVRDVSGTAETKKVSVKDLVESAGVMKDISQLDSATIDDTDYMLVGEGSVPKKATIGALKNHLKTPISIETTNTERIESTYGSFVPQVDGAPLIKEIQGLTVGASQLTLDTPIVELNNHTLREVFETGNLAINGDFSNGSTGWGYTAGGSFTFNNVAVGTVASLYGRLYQIFSNRVIGNSYYITASVSVSVPNSIKLVAFNTGSSSFHSGSGNFENLSLIVVAPNTADTYIGITDYRSSNYTSFSTDNVCFVDLTSLSLTNLTKQTLDYYYSLYRELIDLDGGLPAQYSNGIYTNDDVIIYGTPLVTAKQYSPMFDTTFDLMSEANIKSQFDLWVQENILPHALQSLTNTTIKSVGKNLFDKRAVTRGYYLSTTTWLPVVEAGYAVSNYIKLKPSTTYFISSRESSRARLYNASFNPLSSVVFGSGAQSFTTSADTVYIRFSVAIVDNDDKLNALQLEVGSTATAYEPYKSEIQVFNATIRSAVDNGTIRDKIRYDNGKYVIDRYVDTSTGLALATPLLANETVDVDGTLLQDSVTTLYQEQDLSTVYKVEWSMNAEQSVVTLVQRDKMQQEEIDDLETKMATAQGDIVTLDGEAVKTVQIGDNTAMTPTANKITIPLAVPTGEGQKDGAMTHEDKAKLDSIASGAQVNVLEGVQVNGVDLVLTNKKVNIETSSLEFDKTADYSEDGLIAFGAKTIVTKEEVLIERDFSRADISGGFNNEIQEYDKNSRMKNIKLEMPIDGINEYNVDILHLMNYSENLVYSVQQDGITVKALMIYPIGNYPSLYCIPNSKMVVGYKGTPTSITVVYQDTTSETITSFVGNTYKYAIFTIPSGNNHTLSITVTPSETIDADFLENMELFAKILEIDGENVGNLKSYEYSIPEYSSIIFGSSLPTFRNANFDETKNASFSEYSIWDNSDFSDGLDGWYVNAGTAEILSGELHMINADGNRALNATNNTTFYKDKTYLLAINIDIVSGTFIFGKSGTPDPDFTNITLNNGWNYNLFTMTSGGITLPSLFAGGTNEATIKTMALIDVDYLIDKGYISSMPSTYAELFDALKTHDEFDFTNKTFIQRVDDITNNLVLNKQIKTPYDIDDTILTAWNYGIESVSYGVYKNGTYDATSTANSKVYYNSYYSIDVLRTSMNNNEKIQKLSINNPLTDIPLILDGSNPIANTNVLKYFELVSGNGLSSGTVGILRPKLGIDFSCLRFVITVSTEPTATYYIAVKGNGNMPIRLLIKKSVDSSGWTYNYYFNLYTHEGRARKRINTADAITDGWLATATSLLYYVEVNINSDEVYCSTSI